MSTPVRDHRRSIGQATAAAGGFGHEPGTKPGTKPATTRQHTRRLRAAATVLASSLLASSLLGAGVAAAGTATVQALQSPLRFVSSLDLECFRTSPYVPPGAAVSTRHIHPAQAHLPPEINVVGSREQLCVPVATNGVMPSPDVSNFIRFVDLACYRTSGATLNQPLNLRHLNPVLTGQPAKNVAMLAPTQLCLPVAKNGLVPPPEVRGLVMSIGLKCYGETPAVPLARALSLTHLSPVLVSLPTHSATVTSNRQLCVPVVINNQVIPPDVLNIVRWIDLERYDIATPPLPATVNLTLTHLNPAFGHLPPETASLPSAQQLMLPVATNGLIPPV